MADLSGALDSLERTTVSTRFSLRHVPRPTSIVVVTIDDQSFGKLEHAWPFPRTYHARVISRLHAAGAKAIVYDVQFTEPTTPPQDTALYTAVAAADGVTLATSQSDAQGHTDVLGGDANLASAHARAGAANLTTSSGGVITRYPYAVSNLPSLAVVAAERASGKPLTPIEFQGGDALIDYRGGVGTFMEIPFWKVLRGQIPTNLFRGKIVVVGATAPSLQDLHATPTSGSDLMPGPEVQANAIWTALHGNPLKDAPRPFTLLAILLAALTAPLVALRLKVLGATFAATGTGAGYVVATQIGFNRGTILPVSAPLLALVLGSGGMLAANYFTANTERRVLGWTVRRRTEQLRDAQLEIVTRLVHAAEARDNETGDHITRIGYLCERLALQIGFDPAKAAMLRHASAMHDVGKIGIPDSVLLKPGALDADEWAVMKSHALKGAEILAGSESPLIQMAEAIARSHHERWDGTGYPHGLKSDDIPLVGRICAICDVFDALGSKRPYKEAWPPRQVLAEIANGAGTHFDPALVAAFLAMAPEIKRHPEFTHIDEVDLASLPALQDRAA